MDFAALRKEYQQQTLDESTVHPDPIEQFRIWFQEAVAAGLREPNAMTLATATPNGRPSARIVLLKGFDRDGFVFYTNYESRKGKELEANPECELVFFWNELERQVRIHGRAARVSAAETDAYFRSRPKGARIGAWVSAQSRPLTSREELEQRWAAAEAERGDDDFPPPPYWGGFRVAPESIEFWQGRPSRLHDRLLFIRQTEGETLWKIIRLSP